MDNNKISKISEDGNGETISVYKEDSELNVISSGNKICGTANGITHCVDARASELPEIKLLIDGDLIKSTNQPFNEFFARNTPIIINIDGEVIVDETTPLTQKNYQLVCKPEYHDRLITSEGRTYQYLKWIEWRDTCISSFGYEWSSDVVFKTYSGI